MLILNAAIRRLRGVSILLLCAVINPPREDAERPSPAARRVHTLAWL